jgi:hypothetical protein
MTVWAGSAPVQPPVAHDAAPGPSLAAVLAAAGTRVALLAVGWLVLVRTDSPVRTVVAVAALAFPYALVRPLAAGWIVVTGPRRLATGADLAATVVFAALAVLYQYGTTVLVVLAVVAGVLRGVGDQSHASIVTPPPEPDTEPRPTVPMPVSLVCGVTAGAVVGWVGVVSVVWLAALAFASSAAITIWQTPKLAPATSPSAETARLALVGDLVTQELRTYRPVWLRRVSLRSAVNAAVIDGATQAGAFGLVVLWVRDVVRDQTTLGFVGGAFVVGAFAGSIAGQMRQRALLTCAGIGAGLAVAVAPGMVTSRVPLMTVPIALAAFVAGAVFTTSVPVREVVVDYPGNRPEQLISETFSSVFAYLLAPFAVLLMAVLYEGWSAVGGLLAAGLLYLVGVGLPMVSRPERPAEAAGASEPAQALEPTHPRYGGVTTWIAVTLVYTDGAWTVEVERKNGVSEGTHDVRPTDALRAIDLLDVPGVREEVEKAITDDQIRAEKEAQRLRDELGGVGAKLTAINEMVELSDLWHTPR